MKSQNVIISFGVIDVPFYAGQASCSGLRRRKERLDDNLLQKIRNVKLRCTSNLRFRMPKPQALSGAGSATESAEKNFSLLPRNPLKRPDSTRNPRKSRNPVRPGGHFRSKRPRQENPNGQSDQTRAPAAQRR
jgi:hypothetical protein